MYIRYSPLILLQVGLLSHAICIWSYFLFSFTPVIYNRSTYTFIFCFKILVNIFGPSFLSIRFDGAAEHTNIPRVLSVVACKSWTLIYVIPQMCCTKRKTQLYLVQVLCARFCHLKIENLVNFCCWCVFDRPILIDSAKNF